MRTIRKFFRYYNTFRILFGVRVSAITAWRCTFGIPTDIPLINGCNRIEGVYWGEDSKAKIVVMELPRGGQA